jgi:fructuronate reductase
VPIAAWLQFIRVRAKSGIEIVDPLSDQLTACGQQATGVAREDLPPFLALPGVFPASLASHPGFIQALSSAYERFSQGAPLAVLAT